MLSLLVGTPLIAQQQAGYEITAIVFSIKGTIRQWALAELLDIAEGQRFETLDELEAQLEDASRILNNQRQLEQATVDYRLVDRGDRATAVRVEIDTEETQNFIILPYLTFDSNTGWTIAGRLRHYNFLGTLQEFALNLDFNINQNDANNLLVAPRFTLPFQWLGYQWEWAIDASVSLSFDGELETDFGTTIGIDLPWLNQIFTLSHTQAFTTSTDESEEDPNYLTNRVAFGAEIDTGLDLPFTEDVHYRPEISTGIHWLPGEQLSDDLLGVDLSFSHALLSERVDWIDNFRNGLSAQIGNAYTLNTHTLMVSPEIKTEARGFLALFPIAFGGRVVGLWRSPAAEDDETDTGTDGVGTYVRGIRNDSIEGDLGLFLNSDVSLSLFVIPKIVMGIIIPGLGLLLGPVETHLALFFDMAMVSDHDQSLDLRYAMGIELIGFPLDFRSLFVRLSVGIDPTIALETGSLFGGDNPEIFFGLGHHY